MKVIASIYPYIWFLIGVSVASAQTVLPFDTRARNNEECVAGLQSFAWLCDEFLTPGWERVYDRGFWDTGLLDIQMVDLDEDGMDDLILRVQHTGFCGSAGCSYMFFFADLEVASPPPSDSITSRDHPVIETEDDVRGLRFYAEGPLFSIDEIKRNAARDFRREIGE